ncbi:flagellar biosynthesis protein FlhB [Pokkaliibacter sp. CJK22405]|uniref:flagellar biosynthesis protein FlhB n=1 Tax=Pokkaliibacter sp. CJK22405 TaxID=3384615 RepID=UPI0039849392
MSDQDQEKTEQPTSKRLEEARRKGDVPRSRELTTTVLLVVSGSFMLFFGPEVVDAFIRLMRFNLELDYTATTDPYMMFAHLEKSVEEALMSVLGLLIGLFFAAIAASVLMGGWNFSGEALMPKLSKLNPLSGLKRMFSVNSLIELLKAFAKFVVVAGVAVMVIRSDQETLLLMARQDVDVSIQNGLDIILWGFLWLSSSLVLISLIDVPFQQYQYIKKLKMTKQEVKDEMKNSEGNPEIKGRIRRMQREMAFRRMMANVPKADVVITNPTHYAVALQYAGGNRAPILLAKGEEHSALKIREIAQAHEIPMLEAPELARAIYYNTELDQEIPTGLYFAVAQVLAYVTHLRAWKRRQGPRPLEPSSYEIPTELQHD